VLELLRTAVTVGFAAAAGLAAVNTRIAEAITRNK
jgi:hypothetical protein